MAFLLKRSLASSAASPTGKTTVQLFYDILSPYTYFQFELLSRQQTQWPSMALQFTPVTIIGVMKNADNAPPMMVPAKGRYMMKDLSRLSKFHQLPFRVRPDFAEFAMTRGTINTQRFLVSVQQKLNETSVNDQGKYEQLIRLLFQAFFSPGESANVSDLEVIRQMAVQSGLEPKLVQSSLDDISSADVKAKLQANTELVGELGGFGLPYTTIHLPSGKESIFGSDRMHIVGHLLGEPKPPLLK